MPNFGSLIKTVKNSQKTLFIMCGFPYAGKSFVAEELRKTTDIVNVSIDLIFHEQGFNWDTNKLPDNKAWDDIFKQSYEMTKDALLEGKNVLYDSTNQTVASRDKLRAVAHSVDAEVQIIYIKASIETVWKRWEENVSCKNRSVVSKDLVQKTIDVFEEPAVTEGDIITLNNN